MLSELGRYGASFLLATQSLAKLDTLSPTMRDTLLANVDCLAVFQVSRPDARELTWDLGRQRILEDDIVGQPRHHCYVRASVGLDNLPAFSMTMRKPEFGDPQLAARIRAAADAHLTPPDDIAAQQAERQRRLKHLISEHPETNEGQERAETPEEPPDKPKRKKPRSNRTKPTD